MALDKHNTRLKARQENKRALLDREWQKSVRDRRRGKYPPVPGGKPVKDWPDLETTAFPESVIEWKPGETRAILKSGSSETKLGSDVQVGWLRGAKIYHYSLIERETCPRACLQWATCLGNHIPLLHRWVMSPAFLVALAGEIQNACEKAELGVLVRLHVVGDFTDVGYVRFWRALLEKHDNLFAFCYTAHLPGTPIGDEVAALRADKGLRFSARHSGHAGRWGTTVVDFTTKMARIGDAVVCMEQRTARRGEGAATHCADCGFCWSGASDELLFMQS